MKKLLALILIAVLCLGCAYAAEWAEGRSAAHPYAGVPEVDLTTTMGYIMLYPSAKLPVEHFCDTLHIYLPREDVALGEGKIAVRTADEVICEADFSDETAVTLRPMTEEELNAYIWGGGVCFEVKLPVSISLTGGEYVEMDGGCFSALNGKVQSLPIKDRPEGWKPMLTDDYGVGSVRYSAADDEEGAYKADPQPGDIVTFDLAIKGDAKIAVVYSNNGSVEVDVPEYTASGTVTGRILSEEVDWGVVFLDEAGEVLTNVTITK